MDRRDNQHLLGNEITIADDFGAGLVTLGEVIHIDLGKYPNIARWLGKYAEAQDMGPG